LLDETDLTQAEMNEYVSNEDFGNVIFNISLTQSTHDGDEKASAVD
jgi:hypothetical protein